MNNLIIAILALFIFSSAVNADLLPEGKKKIQYSFSVTNTDSFPGYTFIAFPINSSNGRPMIFASVINKDINISLSCRFGVPVLYAVKTVDFDQRKFDSLNLLDNDDIRAKELESFILSSKFIPSIKIVCSSYADKDAGYYYVEELFRIEKIDTDTMNVRSVKTIYKDKNNNIIDAKDSKSNIKDDIVSPAEKYSPYLFIIIPVLALIAVVSILLIRKMKK
ncbi:MAG: hypothetical protein J0M37_06895 [Ignavibacteria bacterium]|nr:hypothetical protein [Ignavibacteria bacterium]